MNDYGFASSFVIRVGEKAPKFIEILDWYAAVKYFVNSTGTSCDTQNFFEEFEPFKASFEGRVCRCFMLRMLPQKLRSS
jgi:hypothetical protein